jgi:prevent-host-death family protein
MAGGKWGDTGRPPSRPGHLPAATSAIGSNRKGYGRGGSIEMSHVGIRDLSRNPSKVVEEVETTRRPALVTRHGKLVAAIVPVNEEELEDWVLANGPSFVDDMTAADRELAAGETVDLDDFLAEVDDQQ